MPINLDKPILDALFQWARHCNNWKPITIEFGADDKGRIICYVFDRSLTRPASIPDTLVAQTHIGYAAQV